MDEPWVVAQAKKKQCLIEPVDLINPCKRQIMVDETNVNSARSLAQDWETDKQHSATEITGNLSCQSYIRQFLIVRCQFTCKRCMTHYLSVCQHAYGLSDLRDHLHQQHPKFTFTRLLFYESYCSRGTSTHSCRLCAVFSFRQTDHILTQKIHSCSGSQQH